MSVLESISLDYHAADLELSDFKGWLKRHHSFSEREVVAVLKRYHHLCALIGHIGTIGRPNVAKFEFEFLGILRADYVVGNTANGKFVLVEFEGGSDHSIFGPGHTNQLRHWSRELERGFSQIVDWSWAKNDGQHTHTYKNAFGCSEVIESYVLICGRDHSLSHPERSRLLWRNDKTIIAGAKIYFFTYDDLVLHFDSVLDLYRAARDHLTREHG